MAKSLQELIQLKQSARAVPTRMVSAIDWPSIVESLNAGNTLVFKTKCKFALPTNSTELVDRLRKEGLTVDVRVRRPFAEVIVLESLVVTEAPVVERSGRGAKTGIAPEIVKRGPGRPRKNPLAAMGNRLQ